MLRVWQLSLLRRLTKTERVARVPRHGTGLAKRLLMARPMMASAWRPNSQPRGSHGGRSGPGRSLPSPGHRDLDGARPANAGNGQDSKAALDRVGHRSPLAETYNRSRLRSAGGCHAPTLQRLAEALDRIEVGAATVVPLRADAYTS
jgi:hypothetical protein